MACVLCDDQARPEVISEQYVLCEKARVEVLGFDGTKSKRTGYRLLGVRTAAVCRECRRAAAVRRIVPCVASLVPGMVLLAVGIRLFGTRIVEWEVSGGLLCTGGALLLAAGAMLIYAILRAIRKEAKYVVMRRAYPHYFEGQAEEPDEEPAGPSERARRTPRLKPGYCIISKKTWDDLDSTSHLDYWCGRIVRKL